MITPELREALGNGQPVYALAFAEGLEPEPELKVSEWAEKKRIVKEGTSARPGPWRNSNAPYLTEVMDCLSTSHPCTHVSFMKSSQVGGTEVALNWMGYIADVAPADTCYYMPSDLVVKTVIRTKVGPMIEATPAFNRALKSQTSRDENGSSTFNKVLRRGGAIQFLGVNTSANLQTFTFKNLIKDDLTEWPYDVDGRGDPDPMADARTKSYATRGRKIFELSTPGIKGACRITEKYLAGDQRKYFVKCPHCGHEQTLEWTGLRYERSYPYQAHYVCAGNGCIIEHHSKMAMLQPENGARYIPQAPGPGKQPSFYINQLYSTTITWDDTVKEWLEAVGNPRKEKAFYQQVLGIAYEEKGDAPDEEKLFARRERYKLRRIPPTAIIITGSADVQGDRIEYSVYAWDRYGTSWLIDFGILLDDPHQDRVWKHLQDVTMRRYEDCFGRLWPIDLFGVDSGFLSSKVYRFVRSHPAREKVIALDGRGGEGLPPLGSPKKVDVDVEGKKLGTVMLWPVGTWPMKSELYASLRLTIQGPDSAGIYPAGTAHYPEACDVKFFKQLTAEHFRLKERRNATPVPEWVRTSGQSNEQHDLAVYARALYRWMADSATADEWQHREKARLTAPQREQRDLGELWNGAPTATPPLDEQLAAPQGEPYEQSNLTIEDFTGPLPDIEMD